MSGGWPSGRESRVVGGRPMGALTGVRCVGSVARRWKQGDNPSVSFADSSPYTGEPFGGRPMAAPTRVRCVGSVARRWKQGGNPSVSFADSSPYTGEPFGTVKNRTGRLRIERNSQDCSLLTIV